MKEQLRDAPAPAPKTLEEADWIAFEQLVKEDVLLAHDESTNRILDTREDLNKKPITDTDHLISILATRWNLLFENYNKAQGADTKPLVSPFGNQGDDWRIPKRD